MKTPIADFAAAYATQEPLRLHMPGHKGMAYLGPEPWDLTEISGADSLYEAEGIIAESEENASRLFGCQTLYSTEGSSQCIRAMVHLALMYGRQQGRKPLIAAGRNAHKTFLSAAALLDAQVIWLTDGAADSYLSCCPAPEQVEQVLRHQRPAAIYVTSPDYLGGLCDIAALAALCRRYDTLLLVDNAHGAYLRFLPRSLHPVDLGADLCCDSGHKTLPVLTGGAYLHLSRRLPRWLTAQGKNALALFGSTSPSYLILQSLDLANRYLQTYPDRLAAFLPQIERLRRRLADGGYRLLGEEPLKITVQTAEYGYDGREYAALLEKQNIVCEFADDAHVVMMLTPEIGEQGLARLEKAMLAIVPRAPLVATQPDFHLPQQAMSIREAALSPAEAVPTEESVGRILAAASVGCPPAVPIAVCGEVIDRQTAECFQYYGIKTVTVVKE